jgi:hypothetical protein
MRENVWDSLFALLVANDNDLIAPELKGGSSLKELFILLLETLLSSENIK